MFVDMIQLSIVHPRRVNLGSNCLPTVSATNINERESNWEFSSESRKVCRSNGKLVTLHESFITHCSFICIYIWSPELSITENDFSTLLAWGISRLFKKSKSLFLYFNHNHRLMAYSFCLKSISCMLVM